MQKEGLPGLWKGFSKGIGGAAFKPSAGAAGLIGYTGQGIYKAFQKEHTSGVTEYVMAARVADGLLDLQVATVEEKEMIVDMWGKVTMSELDGNTKMTKKGKKKEKRGKGQK
jgi:hypothetical protein